MNNLCTPLRMGRWCSIVGVFLAIGTAHAAMLFSNILVYLQVLVMFFIVPLFGVVILGMLWKRATPAGGFRDSCRESSHH
jgi:SSS family solute:Na+ symporter